MQRILGMILVIGQVCGMRFKILEWQGEKLSVAVVQHRYVQAKTLVNMPGITDSHLYQISLILL